MTDWAALAAGFSSTLPRFLRESETVAVLCLDGDLVVTEINPAVTRLLGRDRTDILGRICTKFVTEADAKRLADAVATGDPERMLLNFVHASHSPQTLKVQLAPMDCGVVIVGERPLASEYALQRELLELNNTLAVLSREKSRQSRELERANRELEETLDRLNRSYWHLRKIQEVLPICMECGDVKTSEATWEPVADYLRKNSLFLSHGYCPRCAQAYRKQVATETEASREN